MLLDRLADNNVLLVRAMGYDCTRSSKLMLADFKTRSVGVEMMKWEAQAEGSVWIGRRNEVESPVESSSTGRQDARGGENTGATSKQADYVRDGRTSSLVSTPLPETPKPKRGIF